MEFTETDSSTCGIISSIKGSLRYTPRNIDTVLREVDETVNSVEMQLSYVRNHHINNTLSVLLKQITTVKSHINLIEDKLNTTCSRMAMKPSQDATTTALQPSEEAELNKQPKTCPKTDVPRDINHNVKSISDIKTARRHFNGPEGVAIDPDSIVVILDTEKPGTTYKFPIVRPQFRQPTRLLKRSSGIHLRLSCVAKPPVVNDDYIDLSDSELVKELDREYTKLVADCEAGIGVFNSPNRTIKLVEDSDSAGSLYDMELTDRAESCASDFLSDIVPLPETPPLDILCPNFFLGEPLTGERATPTATTTATFATGGNVEDKLPRFSSISEVPEQGSAVLEELNCSNSLVDSTAGQSVGCMDGCEVLDSDLTQFDANCGNSNRKQGSPVLEELHCGNDLVDSKTDDQRINCNNAPAVLAPKSLNTDLMQFSVTDGNSNTEIGPKRQQPHTINTMECRLPVQLICDQSAKIDEERGSVNVIKDRIVTAGFNCAQTIESNFNTRFSSQDERKNEGSLDTISLKRGKIDISGLCEEEIDISDEATAPSPVTTEEEAQNLCSDISKNHISGTVEKGNVCRSDNITAQSPEITVMENYSDWDEVTYINTEKASICPENYLEQRQVSSFSESQDAMVIDLTDSDEVISVNSEGTESSSDSFWSSATTIDEAYLNGHVKESVVNAQGCMDLENVITVGVHQTTEFEDGDSGDSDSDSDSDDEVIYAGTTEPETNIPNQGNASSEIDNESESKSKVINNSLHLEVGTFLYAEDSLSEDSKPSSVTSEAESDDVICTGTITPDETSVENVSSGESEATNDIICIDAVEEDTNNNNEIKCDKMEIDGTLQNAKMENERVKLLETMELLNNADSPKTVVEIELNQTEDFLMPNENEFEVATTDSDEVVCINSIKPEKGTAENVSNNMSVFGTDRSSGKIKEVDKSQIEQSLDLSGLIIDDADCSDVNYVKAADREANLVGTSPLGTSKAYTPSSVPGKPYTLISEELPSKNTVSSTTLKTLSNEAAAELWQTATTPPKTKRPAEGTCSKPAKRANVIEDGTSTNKESASVKVLETIDLINNEETVVEIESNQTEDFLKPNENESEVATTDPGEVVCINSIDPEKGNEGNVPNEMSVSGTDRTSEKIKEVDKSQIQQSLDLSGVIIDDADCSDVKYVKAADREANLFGTSTPGTSKVHTPSSIPDKPHTVVSEELPSKNTASSTTLKAEPSIAELSKTAKTKRPAEGSCSKPAKRANVIEDGASTTKESTSVKVLENIDLINNGGLPKTVVEIESNQTEDFLMHNESESEVATTDSDEVVCINSTKPEKGSEENVTNKMSAFEMDYSSGKIKDVNKSHLEQSLDLSDMIIIDDADSTDVIYVKTADVEKNLLDTSIPGTSKVHTPSIPNKPHTVVSEELPSKNTALSTTSKAEPSTVELPKTAKTKRPAEGPCSKPAKRAKICLTTEPNCKTLDAPEPGSDPRWHLMDLTEPEDCFMAVCNQWNCPPPDPHEDLTVRHVSQPATIPNYFMPGSKQKLLQCLSIYNTQLRDIAQQSQDLKFALDHQGWSWSRRKINKVMLELNQLDQKRSTLTKAWDDSYRLYSNYKTSKFEALYISEFQNNQALRHLEMMNMYKSFYGHMGPS